MRTYLQSEQTSDGPNARRCVLTVQLQNAFRFMAMVPALTGATGSSVCLCVPQHYSSGNLKVALKRYLPSRDIEFSDALEPLARPGRCRTMRIGRAGLSR